MLSLLDPTKRRTPKRVEMAAKRTAILQTPVGFSRGVLGHSPWGMQQTIMEDIAAYRRVAVKSCNASGKTFGVADIVLWWITTFPDGIAVTTAPTWTQVSELLWGEIRNTVASPTIKIKYGGISETKLRISEKNYAIGLSTNQSARFSGFHSGRVLIIMDEAEGILPNIWEAINGLRAGGEVRQLAIGNPLIVGGEYYDIFTTKRAGWRTHTINAFDTPNLKYASLEFKDETGAMVALGQGKSILEMTEEELDHNLRPYLCTKRWVREMYDDWGPTHPYFQSRVLGDFPTQGDDTLIPLSWLEKAKLREIKVDPAARVRAGLDVAGPGEAETVLWVMRGEQVLLLKAWPQADPRGEVVAALAPYKDDLESLNVDSIGIGWGIYLHLSDIFDRKTANGGMVKIVHPINVGDAPRDKTKFANAKAEYYWAFRLRCQAGEISGLTDEKAIGQLSVIKYRHNAKGQIEIEGKGELIKRGVKALAIDTPIPTPDGWSSMGDLEVGDIVFDEEGIPTEVLAVTSVVKGLPCYAVRFSDGAEIVAEEGHLWRTHRYNSGLTNAEAQHLRRGIPLHQKTLQREDLRTTWEIRQTLISHQGQMLGKNWWNHHIPLAGSLCISAARLLLSPYVLGYWLGNGDSDGSRVSMHEQDALEIRSLIESAGVAVGEIVGKPQSLGVRLKLGEDARYGVNRQESLRAKLNLLGVLNNKHIPAAYLRASIRQRTELLQGLLDSDGTIGDRGKVEIASSYPALADGIDELIRTLGFKLSTGSYQPPVGLPVRRFSFKAFADQPVFRLDRKRGRQVDRKDRKPVSSARAIVACDSVESVPVRCITVAAKSGMFLAGREMIPTHNSPDRAEAGMLCDARDKKTIMRGFSLDLNSSTDEDVSSSRLSGFHSPGSGRRTWGDEV